ncbi:MAG: hypothetical protein K0S18_93 [Anaerocolumna sp.]|jgi:hypothetical protein|nr:hypothetical protein [Anaerocolumna sp.]
MSSDFKDRLLKRSDNNCENVLDNHDVDDYYEDENNYNDDDWNEYVNDYYENYVAKYSD